MNFGRTASKTDQIVMPKLSHTHASVELPKGFVPIRWVLIPSGLTLDLRRPQITIGRHSQCDLRLPMPDVSRRHARLFFSTEEWVLEDCNSLNGVFVNDERVVRCSLKMGDVVHIGGFSFHVQPAGEAADEQVLRDIAEALPSLRKAS
jgi:pSer/pThr/pTyr-binding forkhead associated (FHA) protein